MQLFMQLLMYAVVAHVLKAILHVLCGGFLPRDQVWWQPVLDAEEITHDPQVPTGTTRSWLTRPSTPCRCRHY